MAATIKDTFKINSSIHNCFPFLSCIQRFNDDKIIITESVNLTLIYDLSKLFCVKSFTFTNLLPLSAPMIYDSTTDQLVAIKNKTKIDLIKNEVECDKVQSIKLDKEQSIKCVLAGANCSCLVVFENNKICELEKIIENESVKEEDCHQLSLPSKDSNLEKLIVVNSTINNLRFWTHFIDQKQQNHYVLFNFNFILNELVTISKIVIKKSDLYKSIAFSSTNLLVISQDHKFKALTQSHDEFIFDLILKDEEKLLDHAYLSLKDNVSAIALLTYDKSENTNYLLTYDLNLKMEMKRILLPNQSENQIKLICFDANIFVQSDSNLIYVPVQTEELSLADLIKTYRSELNLNQTELTFDNLMKYLKETDLKPIDREYLLVEALEQFILNNKQELEINNINNKINGELELNRLDKNKLPQHLVKKLEQLFSFTFNTEFMIQQMKRKQFNRDFLIEILDLLNKALNDQNCAYLINVIDWINVILDSYFICLNSSNNLDLIKYLNQIKIQNDQLILKSKNEKDLKSLLTTLLLAINDESNQNRTRITLPDNKHLGYKFEEIYL